MFTPIKPLVPNRSHGVQYRVDHVGLPMLLSINNSWSCLRVRVLLLQQIEQYFSPNSIIKRLYDGFIQEIGIIKAQIKLAKYLPVRLVDDRGKGLTIPNISSQDIACDYEELSCEVNDKNSYYGSIIPPEDIPFSKSSVYLS